LHVVASLIVIVVGGALARDGGYAVFPFWIALGLLQWIYLYPALKWTRSRGWPGVARGIAFAGGITIALNLLQLASAFSGPLLERITGRTPAGFEYAGTDSRVIASSEGHVAVREGLAPDSSPSRQAEFDLAPDTQFVFRGPAWRDQSRPAGPDWLVPGQRVSISHVLRNGRPTARVVTIWVEEPKPE